MPSINIDLHFFSNRKVGRLTDILGPRSEIYLIKLWCYVGIHWPDTGGSDDWTVGEVERSAAWDGVKGELVRVLCEANFIHRRNNGYFIHDWEEHAGHLKRYREKAKKAIAIRWKRNEQHDPDTTSNTPSNTPSIPQVILNDSPSITNTMQYNTITTYTSASENSISNFEASMSPTYEHVLGVFREITGRKSKDSATKEGARILAQAIDSGELDLEHLRHVIKTGMSDPDLKNQTLRGVSRNFGNYLPGEESKTVEALNSEMAKCEERIALVPDWTPEGMMERFADECG